MNSEPIIMQTLWNSCGVCFFAYFYIRGSNPNLRDRPFNIPPNFGFCTSDFISKNYKTNFNSPFNFFKKQAPNYTWIHVLSQFITCLFSVCIRPSGMLHTQRPSKYYTIQFSQSKTSRSSDMKLLEWKCGRLPPAIFHTRVSQMKTNPLLTFIIPFIKARGEQT